MSYFILIFMASLPLVLFGDYLCQKIFKNKIVSFTVFHLLLVPFLGDIYHIIWFILCYFHGIAHIIHPPFIKTTPNPDYISYYDYVVHGAQCLCIYYYHPNLFPLGVFGCTVMLTTSAITYMDKQFFEKPFWLFASGFGIFGTIYHMSLLNAERNPDIFWATVIIFVFPYCGYLIRSFIPQWDYMMNRIGLFRLWFFNYFVTFVFYHWYLNLNFGSLKLIIR